MDPSLERAFSEPEYEALTTRHARHFSRKDVPLTLDPRMVYGPIRPRNDVVLVGTGIDER